MCGKTGGSCIVLYRNRDDYRNADSRDCDNHISGSDMSAVRLSFILQIKGMRETCMPFHMEKNTPAGLRGQVESYALSTLPDLKQEVHTYIFFAPPFAVLTLTDFTLDFHILLDLLWE